MIKCVLLLGVLASLATAPVHAQFFPRSNWAPREDRAQEQREVPLGQVLRELRREYGGQHLDAEKSDGRYVISWITDDGRRLVIEVDAATGRTLSVRG
jgi:uncharacterized membrane protein YkoI